MKYTPQMAVLAKEYLEQARYPTFVGMAAHMGIDRRLLQKWRETKKEIIAICSGMESKTGRRPLYSEEIVEAVYEYLNTYKSAIPSIAGLAVYIGMPRETLQRWRTEEGKEEFDAACETLLAIQEDLLLNGGLIGVFSSHITKLALGKHGYHEKVDNNLGGQADNPINATIKFVDNERS